MQKIQIVCPHCGEINAVLAQESYDRADCGSCGKSLLDTQPIELTDETFEKHVANSEIPVIVDFWATWCGPCRVMAPLFEEAAARFALKARFVKVDSDEEPATSNRFKLISIPTFVALKNNKEVGRKLGAMSAEELHAWVGQFVGQT